MLPLLKATTVLAIVIAAAIAGCRKTPSAQEEHAPAPPAAASPAVPPQGGMKAYVDPETGKLTDHPAPGAEPLPGDVLTPSTVVEKPAPGGGEELELQGRKKEGSAE
jgi:hypothetical protein